MSTSISFHTIFLLKKSYGTQYLRYALLRMAIGSSSDLIVLPILNFCCPESDLPKLILIVLTLFGGAGCNSDIGKLVAGEKENTWFIVVLNNVKRSH